MEHLSFFGWSPAAHKVVSSIKAKKEDHRQKLKLKMGGELGAVSSVEHFLSSVSLKTVFLMDAPNEQDCWHLIDHSHVKDFEVDRWAKITLALIYSFIFVAGILGNSVTIQTSKILQKKGYMQKAVTDHMISLACSDLLVILLGMPVEFYSIIWNPFSTTKGDITCKLYSFLFEACSYATVLHVATLSFEREQRIQKTDSYLSR
ncbi:G-protein coupled receptor 39 [Crotalus adamanteus]|uniref:G-protein coupled receptor 39 n=1 Tax=Crotalus adamanteus TaxID=8729 RepID=A0AAW1CA34_CROAD